jgi:hypothetical protein
MATTKRRHRMRVLSVRFTDAITYQNIESVPLEALVESLDASLVETPFQVMLDESTTAEWHSLL